MAVSRGFLVEALGQFVLCFGRKPGLVLDHDDVVAVECVLDEIEVIIWDDFVSCGFYRVVRICVLLTKGGYRSTECSQCSHHIAIILRHFLLTTYVLQNSILNLRTKIYSRRIWHR